MGFERPMMLLGALAALVPVVIHLINRARAKRLKFAALEFLFASDKRLARRLRLRQLLVLALRVLLLIAIPFAFAKPFFHPDTPTVAAMSEPGAVVLVIDDSASMGAVAGNDTLMERAVARARELVAAGGPRTSFAVVSAGDPAQVLSGGLTYDRQRIERALGELAARPRKGDMAGALRQAERLLGESTEGAQRVILLTDNAAATWEGISTPWALARVPDHEVVDLRGEDDTTLNNIAILGVAVRVAPEQGPGAVELTVTLRNFSTAEASVEVTVEVAGRKLVQGKTLAPNAAAKALFVERMDLAQDGGSRGIAHIGPDALDLDNRWYFTLDAGGAAAVAVFNGAPRTTAWLDELFFVRAALEPDEGALPRVRATVLSPEDLTKTELAAFDAVFLANVGGLSAAQQLTLENYITKGGSLLVSVGDQLTEEAAKSYGKLLPFEIRGIKTVVARDDPAAELKALTVAQVDGDHPALSEFGAIEDASLFKTKVYAYALVDTAGRDDASVVMSLSGGVPALVEASLGQGKTMLLTTTIDRDWTDLPIRSSFVPFLQQTLLYLAGRLDGDAKRTALVGEVVNATPPLGEGSVTLTRPDGQTRDLGDEPATSYMVLGTDVVGHYTLTRPGGKTATTFAINADRVESDLTAADPAAIAELLSRTGGGDKLPSVGDGKDAAAAAPPPNRTKVWPFVLVLLFVLLASEAWLVLRS